MLGQMPNSNKCLTFMASASEYFNVFLGRFSWHWHERKKTMTMLWRRRGQERKQRGLKERPFPLLSLWSDFPQWDSFLTPVGITMTGLREDSKVAFRRIRAQPLFSGFCVPGISMQFPFGCCNSLAGLSTTDTSFLQFWRLGNPRPWHLQFWCLVRSWFLIEGHLFTAMSQGRRGARALSGRFYKDAHPILEGSPFMISSPPKGPAS